MKNVKSVFYIRSKSEDEVYDWFANDLVEYDDDITTYDTSLFYVDCVEVLLSGGEVTVECATKIFEKWGNKILRFSINEDLI